MANESFRRWVLLCAALILSGCGSSAANDAGPSMDAGIDAGVFDGGTDAGVFDGGIDAGMLDAGTDAGPTRSYWMASTGVQAFTNSNPSIFQWNAGNLATDAEVVTFFGEFYGVPWTELAADAGPSPAWLAAIQSLAAQARSLNKPVFLQLTLGRDGLINDVVETADGGFTTQAGWAPCFDFASDGGPPMKQAWLDYVALMVQAFAPKWVNVGVEINFYARNCPAAWPGVADVINGGYLVAKQTNPNVIAFESYSLGTLYGEENCTPPETAEECSADQLAATSSLKRDRFGISAYPSVAPDQLPADYFSRAATLSDGGQETVVIAETGYNSETIVIGDPADAGSCAPVLPGTTAQEAQYLSRVLSDAQAQRFELVDWWSDRDLLPEPLMSGCPCTYAADWCAIESVFQASVPADPLLGDLTFKAFGSLGLRTYDGGVKPDVYPVWSAALAAPHEP